MVPIAIRAPAMERMSSNAVVAVFTAGGVVILGLLVALVGLLIRAVRKHKQLLADLEERGVVIAQTHARYSKGDQVSRPRAVLKRNTMLPFNRDSGWGALPSVETINAAEQPSILPHYAPPKPAGFMSKSTRLSWPFSARQTSGKAIHMRKIRVPILSTVIESPRPSPSVPVLSASLSRDPFSPRKSGTRRSSDQSLLQHHPAFRNILPETEREDKGPIQLERLRRSLTAKHISKVESRMRPNRSRSVAEIPMSSSTGVYSRSLRPALHARSTSLCSQSSGKAPDAPMPPLPLEIARIKTEARRRSLLSRSPSRVSASSIESVGSSILATRPSTTRLHCSDMRVQKVAKLQWKGSLIGGPRPLSHTPNLHKKNQQSQGSIKSSSARYSMVTRTPSSALNRQARNSTLTSSTSIKSIRKINSAESFALSKVSSPGCSPLIVRSMATTGRQSVSQVTPFGSPQERRKPPSVLRDVSGNQGIPTRQLSQASTQASSTRSSNGNPFQWDSAPLASGKPSALKGSPSARKGHRRQNCVRISLQTTILGPPSRSPSPRIHDIQEESPTTTTERRDGVGLGFSSTRALPRPPSTSVFAPNVKIAATSTRASLTPSSPTLSMANYDLRPIGSPVLIHGPKNMAQAGNRMSQGSLFSIPTFPSPCRSTEPMNNKVVPPPIFSLTRPSNISENELRPMKEPSPSHSNVLISNEVTTLKRPPFDDEYDPQYPDMLYRTPKASPVKHISSPIPTIAEKSSAASPRATDYEHLQSEDSPPCSPKTLRPTSHLPKREEPGLETIDPVISAHDSFSVLNRSLSRPESLQANTQSDISITLSPETAKSLLEPLLDVVFPSNLPAERVDCSRSTMALCLEAPSQSSQSSTRSVYSALPSSSPLQPPLPPCSPRPRHAQLPNAKLSFVDMPTLSPSPRSPRSSPPRPLRSSIQELRRMNSDAKNGGREERRYLRLGREDSIPFPGEESWRDELDEGENEEMWDEEKGRRLVGNELDGWEEATILEEQKKNSPQANAESGRQDRTPESPKEAALTPLSPKDIDRSSSIWEDGEKFWASTPRLPPTSPNKPGQKFIPLSSSPISTPLSMQKNPRKREFEVAKDSPSPSPSISPPSKPDGKAERKTVGTRYRKRSALGVSTLNSVNVRIQVQPPSTGTLRGDGTPGSLYDQDGFLRG